MWYWKEQLRAIYFTLRLGLGLGLRIRNYFLRHVSKLWRLLGRLLLIRRKDLWSKGLLVVYLYLRLADRALCCQFSSLLSLLAMFMVCYVVKVIWLNRVDTKRTFGGSLDRVANELILLRTYGIRLRFPTSCRFLARSLFIRLQAWG